jgi:hypothetical protein
MKSMQKADEVKALINQGRTLLLGGDEKALKDLPAGNWIAGTIPYFMGDEGGLFSQDMIHVVELPEIFTNPSIKTYAPDQLDRIYTDIPENGAAFIIIPALSKAHLGFALNAPNNPDFANKPLIGWIAGVDLNVLGKQSPKVFSGLHPEPMEEGAVVLAAKLPAGKTADISIINLFKQGKGDIVRFPETGFSVKQAFVNGEAVNFAEHIIDKGWDTRLPLVADYAGAMVNISFQNVDKDKGEVAFYAPVFRGMEYRLAEPVKDYVTEFVSQIPKEGAESIVFSCNCILNYLYSELEGKKTGKVTGPITFGEVAYQLLNQTMVYLTVV